MRLVLAIALLAGACKGDPVKCDQGCRNFATLVYWKHADAEIASVPAEQRDALRKKKLGELNQMFERGLDMCVTQCMSANNEADTDCLIAAKTADQAESCVK